MARKAMGLLLLVLMSCGGKQTSDGDAPTTSASDAAPALEGGALDAGSDAAAGVPEECVSFCQARQINIRQCAARDGNRGITETYEQCLGVYHGQSELLLCPDGPSCGGWLSGCLDDPPETRSEDRFPPGTTCTDSVAAGRFHP
jgi:hypothetical protein